MVKFSVSVRPPSRRSTNAETETSAFSGGKGLRRILRSPFLYALLPSVLFYTVILSRDWVPIHDAFQVTNTAYFILNEVVTHHATPLWHPYINYGMDANWYLAITIGPSLAALGAAARLFSRGDLLQYYYLAMFLDELALLIGTYLLGRFLLRKRSAVVFLCIAMTGSTLWYAQPWWNFHIYYFVPLSAYFVVTGCARNELWRVLTGGLVLLVSEFGNLPYFPIAHALAYVLLLAGAWWAYSFDIRSALGRAGAREAAALAASALAAGVYLLLLGYGVDHINYNVGRTRGAAVGVADFLTYGGAIGLSKFAELITGVSWDVEVNAYAGVLVVGLGVFALLWAPRRDMMPFAGVAAFLSLLSLGKGSFVAPLLYEIPGVAYFRHIGLVLPLIKVMLIVISGFGADALLQVSEPKGQNAPNLARRAYFVAIVILIVAGGFALGLTATAAINILSSGHQFVFAQMSDATSGFEQMQKLLSRAAFEAIVYAAAIGALTAAALRKGTTAAAVAALLLVIQTVDVYSYRMSQFQEHMVPIDASYRALFAFADRGFAIERTRDPMTNGAFRVVASRLFNRIEPNWYNQCAKLEEIHCYYDFYKGPEGVLYNTIEPFIGVDPCRSIFRVDYLLRDVDKFYRAATGMPVEDPTALPDGYLSRNIYFPVHDKRVDKAIGCEFPKLQLFSSLTVIDDEREMAALLYDPRYNGDLLLASGRDYAAYRAAGGGGPVPDNGSRDAARPDANTRVQGKVSIVRASANTLVLRTVLPEVTRDCWLYYADAWHPFWHAQVNGRDTPILRANFGFKAIGIPPGPATVRFTYRSGVLSSALAVGEVLLISTTLTVVGVAAGLLIRP